MMKTKTKLKPKNNWKTKTKNKSKQKSHCIETVTTVLQTEILVLMLQTRGTWCEGFNIPIKTLQILVEMIFPARLASFCHRVENCFFRWKKTVPAKIVFAGKNWFFPQLTKNLIHSVKIFITN